MNEEDLKLLHVLFNPYTPFLITKQVSLLPHQINALYGSEVMDSCGASFEHVTKGLLISPPPISALIVDETGLGKTIIAGFLISHYVLTGFADNILVITPKSVTVQWQDELLTKFNLNFKLITDRKQLEEFKGYNIISMDLLKRNYKRIIKSLQKNNSFIDLLIIDEAHHVLGVNETQRYEMAKELSKFSIAKILLKATPFRGVLNDNKRLKEEKRLTRLLRQNFGDKIVYIRRFKDEVRDLNENKLFPVRRSQSVIIDDEIYQKINSKINEISFDKAIKRTILLKRLSSSLSALLTTIDRIKNNSYEYEDFESEQTDDAEGEEPDTREVKELHWSENEVKQLTELYQYIRDRFGNDLYNKEYRLINLVKSLAQKSENNINKIVIFTEYKSTLDSIKHKLKEQNISYSELYGDMELDARKQQINEFRFNDKIKVFISTDAGGEGINLQVAKYQINFDIPWSPIKLEQRFGRIHRIGQKSEEVKLLNFVVKGTLDEDIIEILNGKFDNISKELGDWVFDYIGEVVSFQEILQGKINGTELENRINLIKKVVIHRKPI